MTSAKQIPAITRMFSPSVFRELANSGRSPLFADLYRFTPDVSARLSDESTVADAFELAFRQLRRSGARSEYVYRSALTHNVLLGKHSLNTASMLTEFAVGSSKADLAVLNGTSCVYEIKSERDSLSRLEAQIADYRKVFARVYVIAGQKHLDDVIANTDSDVGVLYLARWNRIRTVREAKENSERLCSLAIFDSARRDEACAILKAIGLEVPNLPNTQIHRAMRALFEPLDPAMVHSHWVHTLKRTRSLASLAQFVDRLPSSLRAAALAIKIRQSDHDRIVRALETPIEEAKHWGGDLPCTIHISEENNSNFSRFAKAPNY